MIITDYQEIFKLDKTILNEIDPEIHKLLLFWKSDKKKITVQTSGSTGNPKKINISKKQMTISAEATLKHFNINENSTFLNCLPVKYIGGKMMLVRAILSKGKIVLCKPLSIPMKVLDIEIDFIALTPLQLGNILDNENIFKKIKLAIVGGGIVSKTLISKINNIPTQCFQTYGMTETVSHIAVRNLKNCNYKTPYKCLNDITIETNKNEQLVINSKKLNIESLITNDKVKIVSDKEFLFLSRIDNIINSGGLKINPLEIENEIFKNFNDDNFFIDKIKNDEFGEEIILIACKDVDIDQLIESICLIKEKKIRPKKIFIVDRFIFNDNQKIDKIKSKNLAIKLKNIHLLTFKK